MCYVKWKKIVYYGCEYELKKIGFFIGILLIVIYVLELVRLK